MDEYSFVNIDMLVDSYNELSDKMTKHRVYAYIRHLKKNDLTPNQYSILHFIEHNGPCSSIKLAEHMELKAATITYLVDSLEKRGLVSRTPNPQDRRSHHVTFTEEGRKIVLGTSEEKNQAIMNSFENLNRDELESLYIMINLLNRKL
ncbi:MarR family winged helix-turn-helix transcriptional regulator [Halobacillus naozhouensis]|uniref:MarR family transcriptional regulator n=1 Tax=Halobacillus naozhouensis TaxID=554880 RepID=A0ABY8IYC0_9BACI|nr:MarR family transcriptional regulator [Halobacillus naozhouensis]WFT74791.1 MarR family transcriptional regulator [Halobacillus naozhouensis]